MAKYVVFWKVSAALLSVLPSVHPSFSEQTIFFSMIKKNIFDGIPACELHKLQLKKNRSRPKSCKTSLKLTLYFLTDAYSQIFQIVSKMCNIKRELSLLFKYIYPFYRTSGIEKSVFWSVVGELKMHRLSCKESLGYHLTYATRLTASHSIKFTKIQLSSARWRWKLRESRGRTAYGQLGLSAAKHHQHLFFKFIL